MKVPRASLLLHGLLLLTFFVILVGAYTRLTDAGLGCPDWPGCYGRWILPETLALKGFDWKKAFTEMLHRYLAGLLGLGIVWLTLLLKEKRWAWILRSLLIFQILLGMWTVTEKLRPIVVMGHLLGGLGLISVLWILVLKSHPPAGTVQGVRGLGQIALFFLLVQIMLGAWVSANYAALVCPSFWGCDELAWNWSTLKVGFNPWTGIPIDPETVMLPIGKKAINMVHRINAIFTGSLILGLVFKLFSNTFNRKLRALALSMVCLLVIQMFLGLQNIKALSLWGAVGHNGVAVLLLLALIGVNYHVRSSAASPTRGHLC